MANTTLSKSVSLNILANAGTAKAELQDVAVTADDLNGKDVAINVNVAGASLAETQLDKLKSDASGALDVIRVKAITSASGVDNLSDSQNKLADETKEATEKSALFIDKIELMHEAFERAQEKVATFKEKLSGLFETIKSISDSGASKVLGFLGGGSEGGSGGGEGAAGGLAEGLPMIGGVSPLALVAIVPAIEAALVEVTGLVSGFAAAGAGAGAFALLAIPAFDTVKKAMGDTSAQLAKLSPDERGAVEGVKALKSEWQGMSKAFEPSAFKVFNDGLKLAKELLPDVTPFAQTFANALDGLLKKADKFADSKGFKDWLNDFHKLEGPSVTAIGDGIGKVAIAIGKLLTTMSSKDVVHSINIAFDILVDTIKTVAYIVHTLMSNWDSLSNATDAVRETLIKAGHAIEDAVDAVREAFIKAGHAIEDATDAVRESVIRVGHDIESAFNTARHAVATAGHDIASAFDRVRHDVAAVGDAIVKGLNTALQWVKSHWKIITAWFVDPVGMAVYEIRTHLHEIAAAFDKVRHDVASILAGFRHDISSDFASMRHDIAAAADWIPNEIKKAFDNARKSGNSAIDGLRHDLATDWDNMRHDLASFADWVPHEIATLFDAARHDAAAAIDGARHDLATDYDNMRHDIATFADNVVSFFKALPGKILATLESLPGKMLTMGKNIIDGLINGIKSAAADIPGIMKGLASDVESYFTNPLKMFSPSRVFMAHGQNIVAGLAIGIQQSEHLATGAIGQLAGKVSGAMRTSLPTSSPGASAKTTGGNTFNITVQGIVGDAGATGRQIVQSVNTYLRQTGQGQLGTA